MIQLNKSVKRRIPSDVFAIAIALAIVFCIHIIKPGSTAYADESTCTKMVRDVPQIGGGAI